MKLMLSSEFDDLLELGRQHKVWKRNHDEFLLNRIGSTDGAPVDSRSAGRLLEAFDDIVDGHCSHYRNILAKWSQIRVQTGFCRIRNWGNTVSKLHRSAVRNYLTSAVSR